MILKEFGLGPLQQRTKGEVEVSFKYICVTALNNLFSVAYVCVQMIRFYNGINEET